LPFTRATTKPVAIDRGKGSARVVRRLASGVYDLGHRDINVVMDFNSKNPAQAVPMMGYEQTPAAIIMRKVSGIATPKQLAAFRFLPRRPASTRAR